MGKGLLWRGVQKSQPAQGLGRCLGRGSEVVNVWDWGPRWQDP